MEQPDVLAEGLLDRDDRRAYSCLKQLEELSRRSAAAYPCFDRFAALLQSPSSYQRSRGIRLVAANARWDTAGRVEALLPALLAHIADEKPATARQCIQALPAVAEAKPALRPAILAALAAADPSGLPDSMRPLVQRDLRRAMREIASL